MGDQHHALVALHLGKI